MRVCFKLHGLHAVCEIVDLKAMKSQHRMRNISDCFDAGGVGAALCNFETIGDAMVKNIFVCDAKQCPDATHFVISHLKLKSTALTAIQYLRNMPKSASGRAIATTVASPNCSLCNQRYAHAQHPRIMMESKLCREPIRSRKEKEKPESCDHSDSDDAPEDISLSRGREEALETRRVASRESRR